MECLDRYAAIVKLLADMSNSELEDAGEPMAQLQHLSRRERQIMDIIFARGEATVRQIQAELPDPPTDMAVRRMLHILEEKSHLRRRQQGREVVYFASQSK